MGSNNGESIESNRSNLFNNSDYDTITATNINKSTKSNELNATTSISRIITSSVYTRQDYSFFIESKGSQRNSVDGLSVKVQTEESFQLIT